MKTNDRKIAEGILFTDFYQLTMAQLYYRQNIHEKHVRFEYFFREYPDYGAHKAGYCINAGLEWLLEWMNTSRFDNSAIARLVSHKSRSGKLLFEKSFLKWLQKHGNFNDVSLTSVPEGRVVHPNVPIVGIEGPLAVVQILESALLNTLNYQTLIATKAARIKEAACGQPLLEFGLRRGHNKGTNAGSRAALIGGADFTSNTGISYILGYPPKGTHAHSMVQVFMATGGGELGAFKAYADIYPDDCLLLVDTIDTLNSGIPNAIKVFEDLRSRGHEPVGIRLDSGDLAFLSIQAARMLNDANFPDAKIVLSNQLDELVTWQIITQIKNESIRYGIDPDSLIKRLIYGVGTGLITSKGDPALDGVYKLVAINDEGNWIPAFKISESPNKIINPGKKNVWRIYDTSGKAVVDMLALEKEKPEESDELVLHHPTKTNIKRVIGKNNISRIESLLVDILKDGKLVYNLPTIDHMREVRKNDMDALYPGVKRIVMPHDYHISLSEKLWLLKQDLVRSAKT